MLWSTSWNPKFLGPAARVYFYFYLSFRSYIQLQALFLRRLEGIEKSYIPTYFIFTDLQQKTSILTSYNF